MKYSIITLLFLVFVGCKDAKQSDESAENTNSETTEEQSSTQNSQAESQSFFGEEFDFSGSETAVAALEKYKNLKPGDTILTTFTSTVNSVCEKKGCWMRLKLDENEESLVRFKDYGFFVPKDIQGQKAVVHGKLFVEETSVEDLKHYAKDAGKSEQEIAAITEPKLQFSFEADGVYLGK